MTSINDRLEERYLTVKEVSNRHGCSTTTVWERLNSDPSFPRPKKLGARMTRWKLSEVVAWEEGLEEVKSVA